jgi:hypothetical protein
MAYNKDGHNDALFTRHPMPARDLYHDIAVPLDVLQDIFEEPLGELLLRNNLVQVMGFDPQEEVIVKWLP